MFKMISYLKRLNIFINNEVAAFVSYKTIYIYISLVTCTCKLFTINLYVNLSF